MKDKDELYKEIIIKQHVPRSIFEETEKIFFEIEIDNPYESETDFKDELNRIIDNFGE